MLTTSTPIKEDRQIGESVLPSSLNRADSVTASEDGSASCLSATSGQTYTMAWDAQSGDVVNCGCTGFYRYRACRHIVLLQLTLDTARQGHPDDVQVIGARNLSSACDRCGGVVIYAILYVPNRGYLRLERCAGCGRRNHL